MVTCMSDLKGEMLHTQACTPDQLARKLFYIISSMKKQKCKAGTGTTRRMHAQTEMH